MKIELGKQYRTRQGIPVRIYAVDGDDKMPIHGAFLTKHGWKVTSWDRDGKWLPGGHDGADLIEVKPRIKRKVWINLYPQCASTHGSKDEADAVAALHRIACVEIDIDVEEGHGL